jgi:hypothetical protein
MAFDEHKPGFTIPLKAASVINPITAASGYIANGLRPVAQAAAEEAVVPVTAVSQEPIGFAKQASYAIGDRVTVYEEGNYVKAVAAASLGAGADVGCATSGGQLSPVTLASGTWRVGKSLGPAGANEVFTVLIKPIRL